MEGYAHTLIHTDQITTLAVRKLKCKNDVTELLTLYDLKLSCANLSLVFSNDPELLKLTSKNLTRVNFTSFTEEGGHNINYFKVSGKERCNYTSAEHVFSAI
mgnify:CR=1 FL=1